MSTKVALTPYASLCCPLCRDSTWNEYDHMGRVVHVHPGNECVMRDRIFRTDAKTGETITLPYWNDKLYTGFQSQ